MHDGLAGSMHSGRLGCGKLEEEVERRSWVSGPISCLRKRKHSFIKNDVPRHNDAPCGQVETTIPFVR
jgi:hypothetical protein